MVSQLGEQPIGIRHSDAGSGVSGLGFGIGNLGGHLGLVDLLLGKGL